MTTPEPVRTSKTIRWTLIAFIAAGVLISSLVVWQLAETTPTRWCAVAKAGSPELATGCFTVLLKLLEIKDHAVLGLLAILGLTVLSIVVVALGVRLQGTGPGGFTVDVASDKTTISAGDAEATVPTPPSAS